VLILRHPRVLWEVGRVFQSLERRKKSPAFGMVVLHDANHACVTGTTWRLLPARHETVPEQELFEGAAPREAHREASAVIDGRGEAPGVVLGEAFVPRGEIEGIGQTPEP
jgi:hypothetical protein